MNDETPNLEAVQQLVADPGFKARVVNAARAGTGTAKAVVVKMIQDEITAWKQGGSGVYKSVHFQRPDPDEVQAMISLAVHTALMAVMPGSLVAEVSGTIARFLGLRVFSSLAWRAINKASHRIVRAFSESNDILTFGSSAEAERFIHKNAPLRRASAFSWWLGHGNLWGVAINRGGTSFIFCQQRDGQFWAGGQLLERSAMLEPLDEHVDALIGPAASLTEKKWPKGPHRFLTRKARHGPSKVVKGLKRRPRQERLDYSKTKAPNFKPKVRRSVSK